MSARIRCIKPAFFLHDGLAELSPFHRLLFIGLWTLADKEGRLEDRPKRIKAALFPWDEVNVESMLADLAERGFIVRYEVGDLRCIAIPKWSKHQRPHPKEAASELPPPPTGQSAKRDPSISREWIEDQGCISPDSKSVFPREGDLGGGNGFWEGDLGKVISDSGNGNEPKPEPPPPPEKQDGEQPDPPIPIDSARRKQARELECFGAMQNVRLAWLESRGIEPTPDKPIKPAHAVVALQRITKAVGGDLSDVWQLWLLYLSDDWPAKYDEPWCFNGFASSKTYPGLNRRYLNGERGQAPPIPHPPPDPEQSGVA